jgi:ribosome assembly protein 1
MAGPLCEEPLWGVCYVLEAVAVPSVEDLPAAKDKPRDLEDGGLGHWAPTWGQTSGQLVVAMKIACRGAVLNAAPRLVQAMCRCELQCSMTRGGDPLGRLYGVISKRRGVIVKVSEWVSGWVGGWAPPYNGQSILCRLVAAWQVVCTV